MLEVELRGDPPRGDPTLDEIAYLCELAAASGGVFDGHLAIAFVDEQEIAALNDQHRGREGATDVLSFPIDGAERAHGPRELGDVVICPQRTADIREAVLHGVLHLLGMDHERDEGEMLVLQAELLRWGAEDRARGLKR
ncbi:MAG: rRNA maturation RNase YbeY [Solirubrobacterales bacterium]|nr:MAG: rRNA maturation RNase YbeY [Solirubrobacterales bacterium]